MLDAKIKAEQIFKQMNESDQRKAVMALIEIETARSTHEIEKFLKSLSGNIKEFVLFSVMSSIEDFALEDKKKTLKLKDAAIREDALKILCALLSAGGNESDEILLRRSMDMARRLHEYF